MTVTEGAEGPQALGRPRAGPGQAPARPLAAVLPRLGQSKDFLYFTQGLNF